MDSENFIENEQKKNPKEPLQLTIIYGKEFNLNNEGEHPLKRTVKQLILDMQQTYDFLLQEDPQNTGQAFCRVQSKIKQENFKSNPNQIQPYSKSVSDFFNPNNPVKINSSQPRSEKDPVNFNASWNMRNNKM